MPARACADLEYCRPPDSKYVRRMATFHDFDPLALWGFLTSGSYARCPPGRTLLAEGAPSPAYYLTINGAVEQVLVRGNRRIRVGLAGPGKAFGYEGLIDGRPSPVTAITRERALLLVAAARPVRAALQRRGRRLPRLPRRDPEGPGAHPSRDVAPVHSPRGERVVKPSMASPRVPSRCLSPTTTRRTASPERRRLHCRSRSPSRPMTTLRVPAPTRRTLCTNATAAALGLPPHSHLPPAAGRTSAFSAGDPVPRATASANVEVLRRRRHRTSASPRRESSATERPGRAQRQRSSHAPTTWSRDSSCPIPVVLEWAVSSYPWLL